MCVLHWFYDEISQTLVGMNADRKVNFGPADFRIYGFIYYNLQKKHRNMQEKNIRITCAMGVITPLDAVSTAILCTACTLYIVQCLYTLKRRCHMCA